MDLSARDTQNRAADGRLEIREIEVYQVDLPLHEGSYKWSGGKGVEVFDCTLVKILTSKVNI